ncbi:hypothetical protein GEMRC1_008424 [Eukaryota sp. GEM-RC1]
MVNYTKQYVVSLSVLFIILSMFYFGSLIGFTQLRPLPRLIQDYGTRSALITRSTNDVVSALIDSEQQVHYLNNAKISLHSLTRLHHALVVNHIDKDFKQTELLFDSKFIKNSKAISSLDENHGLHSFLINYINFAELFATQDISIDYSNSSPDLANLLIHFDTLSEMSLEAIDNIHSYSIKQIDVFSTYIMVVFIGFIVVLATSYVFVFRTMLRDLKEEEVLTLEFLEMIPEGIMSKISGIQSFLATIQ